MAAIAITARDQVAPADVGADGGNARGRRHRALEKDDPDRQPELKPNERASPSNAA
jgi:hypothetical protein